MKLNFDITKYQNKSSISSERQLVIGEFLERLNQDRKPPYKPLTAGFIASKMSLMTTSELKTFLADCKYAKNFSSFWWWSLKPK
jgi:hypothetical protein